MRVVLCQISPSVSDVNYNVNLILENYNKADGDVVIMPELCVCGYMAQDNLLCEEFLKTVIEANDTVARATKEKLLIFGSVFKYGSSASEKLLNVAILAQNGKMIGFVCKTALAKDGIFNEHRYFIPNTANYSSNVFSIKGKNCLIAICEDFWQPDVIMQMAQDCTIDYMFVINASPFWINKKQQRLALAELYRKRLKCCVVYVNQVCANTGTVFDGGSFVLHNGGKLELGKSFAQERLTVDLTKEKNSCSFMQTEEEIYSALVYGVREYFTRNKFSKAVIGISGGVDSALCATICVDALGAQNVFGYMLKTNFNSSQSYSDAVALAKNLGIKNMLVEIEGSWRGVEKQAKEALNCSGLKDLTLQNIQSRFRGMLLMTIANEIGALNICCSNKSEIAVGYSTLYGDTCGGYAPIKDLYKTDVYSVCKWRNESRFNGGACNFMSDKLGIIPLSIVQKEPTAELKDGQKDSDSLPQYDVLDDILRCIIQDNMSNSAILTKIQRGGVSLSVNLIETVRTLLKQSQHKRLQLPPGTKIYKRGFDASWKTPSGW